MQGHPRVALFVRTRRGTPPVYQPKPATSGHAANVCTGRGKTVESRSIPRAANMPPTNLADAALLAMLSVFLTHVIVSSAVINVARQLSTCSRTHRRDARTVRRTRVIRSKGMDRWPNRPGLPQGPRADPEDGTRCSLQGHDFRDAKPAGFFATRSRRPSRTRIGTKPTRSSARPARGEGRLTPPSEHFKDHRATDVVA